MNLRVFSIGIRFGKQASVKLSTSYKDILLIAGIVVAIIISITTWYSRSTAQTSQITPLSTPKLNTSSISKKLGQVVLNIAKQHR